MNIELFGILIKYAFYYANNVLLYSYMHLLNTGCLEIITQGDSFKVY